MENRPPAHRGPAVLASDVFVGGNTLEWWRPAFERRLGMCAALGVRTVIGPHGDNHDGGVDLYLDVAAQFGLSVVLGVSAYDPMWQLGCGAGDPVAAFWRRVDASPVRPRFVYWASGGRDPQIRAQALRMLRPAVEAHLRARMTLCLDLNEDMERWRDLARQLHSFGVEFERTVYAAAGAGVPFEFALEVLESGAMLALKVEPLEDHEAVEYAGATATEREEFDRSYPAAYIAQLCAMGFADQLVVSTTRCSYVWLPAWECIEVLPSARIAKPVQPIERRLRRCGVSQDDAQAILHDNPVRLVGVHAGDV